MLAAAFFVGLAGAVNIEITEANNFPGGIPADVLPGEIIELHFGKGVNIRGCGFLVLLHRARGTDAIGGGA